MAWSPKQYLAELDRIFREIESRFELLQKIDRRIATSDSDVEEFLCCVLRDVGRMGGADEVGLVFLNNPAAPYLKVSEGGLREPVERPELVALARRAAKHPTPRFAKAGTMQSLAAPIRVSGGVLYGVLVLSNRDAPDESSLQQATFKRFALQVSIQLGILVNASLEQDLQRLQSALGHMFIDHSSHQASDVLDLAAKLLLDHIPPWEPLRFARRPAIQMFVLSQENSHLVVVASRDDNDVQDIGELRINPDIGKRMSLDDSVCGHAVKGWNASGDRRPLVTNPQKDFKKIYKSFSGEGLPSSELVVPLVSSGRLIGVLNLEHGSPKAFSELHVLYFTRIAEFIGPFVESVIRAAEIMSKKNDSLLFTMYGFLFRLNKTFVHKVGQKQIGINLALSRLVRRLDGVDEELAGLARSVAQSFKDYVDVPADFLKSAPEYIMVKKIEMASVIKDAVKQFDKRSSDEHNMDIELEELDDKYYIRGSLLLKEHIYDLINNSKESIIQRNKDHRRNSDRPLERGKIAINIRRSENRDDEGRPILGARIVVTIEDNGIGVPEEKLAMIGEYGESTKNGTGYGLPAAKDYVKSLGGGLRYGNLEGRPGFFVEFYMEEFDSNRPSNNRISL